MSKEIVNFLTPTSFVEAKQVAEFLSQSDLIPSNYKGKPADIVVAMAFGSELDLKPLAALRNIAVINGRPSLWGDLVLALIKTKDDYEYIKESFDDIKMIATCEIKRKNEPVRTVHFSQKDAEAASLWGKSGTWKTHPKRMLQMRARAFAIRDVFPHHLSGITLAEEAEEMTDTPNYNTSSIQVVEDVTEVTTEVADAIETTAEACATFEQVEKIRNYLFSLKSVAGDEAKAIDYVNKKLNKGITTLNDLTESEADSIISKIGAKNE